MLKEYFQLFLLYLTDILYWFKSLYKGLKNLIYYFKVIYKDRHIDFLYIYKLELYKIQGMLKYYKDLNKNPNLKYSNESIIRDLLLAEYLLKMLTGDPSNNVDYYVMQGYKFIKFNKYVNFRNASRFISKRTYQYYIKTKNDALLHESNKMYLYKTKCLYLYNKLKSYKSYTWDV